MNEFNIEELPVIIRYIGEVSSPWGDKNKVDQWQVTIKDWNTPFYTGLGCRSPAKEVSYEGSFKPPRAGTMAYEAWKRASDATRKPVKPSVAEVLSCLFSDASAGEESFSSWCSNFGYSDDSLKALETYRTCQATYDTLNRLFDRATREAIKLAVEDL
jgi:hypothetical protein